jgi:hypothetical protein
LKVKIGDEVGESLVVVFVRTVVSSHVERVLIAMGMKKGRIKNGSATR